MDIPGPLGESALEILESLPKISVLNGVMALMILEQAKHVVDSKLQPRLPECTADEPLADRVLSAMWLCLMTYRLADEEKIDETSVWYAIQGYITFMHFVYIPAVNSVWALKLLNFSMMLISHVQTNLEC